MIKCTARQIWPLSQKTQLATNISLAMATKTLVAVGIRRFARNQTSYQLLKYIACQYFNHLVVKMSHTVPNAPRKRKFGIDGVCGATIHFKMHQSFGLKLNHIGQGQKEVLFGCFLKDVYQYTKKAFQLRIQTFKQESVNKRIPSL